MVKIIEIGLLHQHDLGASVTRESVKFFQSLLMYVQRGPKIMLDHMDMLRSIAIPMISLLDSEDLFDASQELISDVVSNYETFFTSDHYTLVAEMLIRPRTESWMADLLSGNFGQDQMAYGRLLLSYGEARPESLAYSIHTNDQQILHRLVSLTQCAGLAIIEDEIISQVLDFWSNFVESSMDLCLEETLAAQPDWLKRLQKCTQTVIEALMLKIRLPATHVLHEWDHDSKLALQEMRRDFQHFLASAHNLLGPQLFESFVAYTSRAWQEHNWEAVEASLFSINGISILLSDSGEGDGSLSALFASALFSDMTNPDFSIPFKTQQTAVNLVGGYADFFKRQPTYLAPILSFMFNCLESQALMHTSAKTIFALCDVCRTTLGEYAMPFALQYHSFVTSGERETEVKEKLIGAMAAVIQGLSIKSRSNESLDQQDILDVLNKLLDTIEMDVNNAIASLGQSVDYARERGLCAVSCLASMGRALRAPDSAVVDILSEPNDPFKTYQLSPTGMQTQTRIIELYSKVLEIFPSDGEILEVVCNIFRAGITESSGPFVLPLEALESILYSYSSVTSRAGFLLETITRVLRKHYLHSARRKNIEGFSLRCLQRALQWVGWIQGLKSEAG